MPNLDDLLRRELLAARRSGDRAVAAAVQSALAALANAEAVPAEPGVGDRAEGPVGVAATDVARREVGVAERRAIVEAEVADLHAAVTMYARQDPERAARATAGAAALERVLGAMM